MTFASFGSTSPLPRQVADGWIIPFGVTSEQDTDGNTLYSGHEVFSLTLFQHDIEAAVTEAALPEGDYTADIHDALCHGIRLQRAAEYPPSSEYLDGVAKADQAQIDAYCDACLAIKAKYPFPDS